MTLDGFCDHTAVDPDEEVHDHYTNLLRSADTILYGRITYGLMESYWPGLIDNPSGERSMDEFAAAIDNIPKIVLSHTMKDVTWKTARLAKRDLIEEVSILKQEEGGDILAGSRSLIITLLNHDLIDEFQLCVHPVICGKGSTPLFENIENRMKLELMNTKVFTSGAVIFYYKPGQM